MEARKALKHTHPILIIAGVAVTLFSMVGIAAVMGWIPTSTGQNAPTTTAVAPSPVPPAPVVAEAPPAPPAEAPAPPKPRHSAARARKSEPAQVAMAEAPMPPQVAQIPPPPPPAPVVPICHECGVIDGIHAVDLAGKASGGGAIGGAILGGVAGHQMGRGTGQDVMTVIGALGGALAGNTIEKKATESKEYEILVRFDDGSTRVVKSPTQPTWHVGDKVRMVNGVLQANG
jgi:outer membrane lipoprotein SlyB